MATGYEVSYYHNVASIADSLKKIAAALEARNIADGVDER